MGRLDERVMIVTGGASGIGKSTALLAAQEGARVVIADRNLSGAEAVSHAAGDRAIAVRFDATDAPSIDGVVRMAIDHFGRIDILHNNVAMTADAWARDTTVLETTLETWDLTFSVNLRSQFIACKAVLPHMIRQGGGSIINMASGSGHKGASGLVAYGTSKAAIMGFTRYMAVQYGRHNIRTNAIAPGVVLTEQIKSNKPELEAATLVTLPFPRVGVSSDIAGMVVFLASDEAAYVNGQTINCDGGATAGVAPTIRQ
ncbi:SDR family oxidoreductase [Ochrobactrum pecoris]|uniref:NAD(P)-dependent dehydrogenase (Short-subunit alcohol dehydrogenase family) n=1 Tax=Brucella pecoris TaxID=867683 RepID=A0A5C5CCS3_9HYPH|nr:SDR family NAD(P)-dependent oxidoreductase [Brucella pecoris]MBB4095876.1 NAD(P)-dependent dehydrogenase (short-subunit alcohol dehydrogenase family) [Brucella pecoris]NKW82662.1 SDR family oxidoreductase [Brucella pecoris]TNV09102.1 SDR family oxidoreductase [Brucella pecoris]